MSFSPGDLLIVDLPHVEWDQSDFRPAVVVSRADWNQQARDFVVMPITRQRGNPHTIRLHLPNWRAHGLREESWIKPVFLTLDRSSLRREIGRLDAAALLELQRFVGRILMPLPTAPVD